MFKLFSIIAVLAVFAVFALAQPQPPNPTQMKSEMSAAGISSAAISTISTFMESHKPGNSTSHKTEMDAMLATLTESDRSAFQKMMEAKHPRGSHKN